MIKKSKRTEDEEIERKSREIYWWRKKGEEEMVMKGWRDEESGAVAISDRPTSGLHI